MGVSTRRQYQLGNVLKYFAKEWVQELQSKTVYIAVFLGTGELKT